MAYDDLAKTIDEAFEARAGISLATMGPVRDAVETALELLDSGKARVAEKQAARIALNLWKPPLSSSTCVIPKRAPAGSRSSTTAPALAVPSGANAPTKFDHPVAHDEIRRFAHGTLAK